MIFENNMTFANRVNKDYSKMFAQRGNPIGGTYTVRKPPQYTVTQGNAIDIQDSTDESVAITFGEPEHVAFTFSSSELTLNIGQFADRYLKSAVSELANRVDFTGMQLYRDIYNTVGTPGTVPAALLTYLNAGVKLENEAAPMDDMRYMCLNPLSQATILDALKGLQQSSTEIAKQYKKGVMGTTIGFEWCMDQNVNVHTIGVLGGTPLMNGATASGASTLVTDGWTASVATRLKRGDVFTVADVYGVNPRNKQSTGQLRQFVCTADAASDGSGNMTISISPTIYSTGARQNIDALPADGAALTVFGAASTVTPQNLAFHRDAFTCAMVELEMPSGVDFAARKTNPETGISIRVVRQYDINTNFFPCRLDIQYAWTTLRPELACRVAA